TIKNMKKFFNNPLKSSEMQDLNNTAMRNEFQIQSPNDNKYYSETSQEIKTNSQLNTIDYSSHEGPSSMAGSQLRHQGVKHSSENFRLHDSSRFNREENKKEVHAKSVKGVTSYSSSAENGVKNELKTTGTDLTRVKISNGRENAVSQHRNVDISSKSSSKPAAADIRVVENRASVRLTKNFAVRIEPQPTNPRGPDLHFRDDLLASSPIWGNFNRASLGQDQIPRHVNGNQQTRNFETTTNRYQGNRVNEIILSSRVNSELTFNLPSPPAKPFASFSYTSNLTAKSLVSRLNEANRVAQDSLLLARSKILSIPLVSGNYQLLMTNSLQPFYIYGTRAFTTHDFRLISQVIVERLNKVFDNLVKNIDFIGNRTRQAIVGLDRTLSGKRTTIGNNIFRLHRNWAIKGDTRSTLKSLAVGRVSQVVRVKMQEVSKRLKLSLPEKFFQKNRNSSTKSQIRSFVKIKGTSRSVDRVIRLSNKGHTVKQRVSAVKQMLLTETRKLAYLSDRIKKMIFRLRNINMTKNGPMIRFEQDLRKVAFKTNLILLIKRFRANVQNLKSLQRSGSNALKQASKMPVRLLRLGDEKLRGVRKTIKVFLNRPITLKQKPYGMEIRPARTMSLRVHSTNKGVPRKLLKNEPDKSMFSNNPSLREIGKLCFVHYKLLRSLGSIFAQNRNLVTAFLKRVSNPDVSMIFYFLELARVSRNQFEVYKKIRAFFEKKHFGLIIFLRLLKLIIKNFSGKKVNKLTDRDIRHLLNKVLKASKVIIQERVLGSKTGQVAVRSGHNQGVITSNLATQMKKI
ncbi:MAG: hypothetical protein N2654_05240, partial [Deltaproteobacteria bacterium]|nr:hypothetical protein [Deltaproteobacteria bacterium]